jgi:phosphoserine phosphatase RsbU/P
MTPEPSIQEGSPEAPTSTKATARLEDVQRVTESALAYLDLEDLLRELLDRVVDILQADTSAVLLLEDDGRTLTARAAKGLEEEVERGFKLPTGAGFAGRVAATRAPVVIEDLEDSPIQVVNPLLREKGIRSLLGVPLVAEGDLIGVLHVGRLTKREFDDGEIELLQLVGDRVALAIERSRLAVQDRIARTLQRSLIPPQLPAMPGLTMAARYLPASGSETTIGGDWYDVIELGPREIGLMMGDVAGRGMVAATFMGQLRSATRAYALDGASPGELVGKLSRFADLETPRMATVLYATLNLDTLEVELARAGHPYPLLCAADGTATFLDAAKGPPVGAGVHTPYTTQRLTMQPGETLLLYTDGLIERRGKSLTEGEQQLADAAASAPAEPEAKCTEILEQLTGGKDIDDDIAILAVHTTGLGDSSAIAGAGVSPGTTGRDAV